MSEGQQTTQCQGNMLGVLSILAIINANYYIGFELNLAEMGIVSILMYMLPVLLYSGMLAMSYYIAGLRPAFHSMVVRSDGGTRFDSSHLLGDIVRLAAFLAITFWPTYAFVLAEDAPGTGLSDSYFTHIWQYTLFFFLVWLFFFTWVANGLFTAAFVYGAGGIVFYIGTRLWDFASFMTADAETWWGKGIGFIAAFIIGGLLFLFAVYVWTAWMRDKAGLD